MVVVGEVGLVGLLLLLVLLMFGFGFVLWWKGKKAKFCVFVFLCGSMRKMGKWGGDVDRRAHLGDRSQVDASSLTDHRRGGIEPMSGEVSERKPEELDVGHLQTTGGRCFIFPKSQQS